MLDLLLFCLVVFGAVNIITISKIGAPWRKKASEINTKLGELFHCPMCMGFWVGLVLSFWKSPTDFIFFDAILGSAAAWIIYCITWSLALKDPRL
tara:strand:- start:746 stop:1030 length:285 start_codon:yes stop_codon:yes gene_type:complete